MKLKEILVNCNLLEIIGEKDIDILDISFDSRKVSQGTLFFAVKGTQVDGHDYIDAALAAGASAVVSPPAGAWRSAPTTSTAIRPGN